MLAHSPARTLWTIHNDPGGAAVSTEQNKALARRYFDRVVNNLDRAAAAELVAPELVFHSPYAPTLRDRDSFMGMLEAVHTALRGFKLVEHEIMAEGALVATRWMVHATHEGELGGMPPSGQKVEVSGLSIYRIANGKIVEGWVQDDIVQALMRSAQGAQTPASVG